jgi:hypothetical protein
MAIPSRQIGWSTTDNLLWQISKQLEYLTQITAHPPGSTTTTTSSSSSSTSTSTSSTSTSTTTTTTTIYNGLVTYRLSNADYPDTQTACADSGKLDSPSDYTLVYMMGEPAPDKPFFLNPELTVYANAISFGNRVMKQVDPIAGPAQFVTFNNQAVFTLGNC